MRHLHQVLQPLACAIAIGAPLVVARLVLPVCGDTGFGDSVHLLGSNLHLDGHAVRAEQRRVQRLIAVDAGDRDVVFEASRHRAIEPVYEAEHAVAGVDRVDDDPEAEDIDDGRKRRALAAHFLIDAVEVFLAAFHSAGDVRLLERIAQVLRDFPDELLLIAARSLERLLDDPIAPRVERLETELFELGFDRVNAEAVRDRRVNLERLARDGAPLRRRHGAERAHVVRAIGELDHDDANVAHHREQHFAKALGLRFGTAAELNVIELRDPIDELRDVGAEALGDLILRGGRVLDDVVQDRCDDRRRIEVQIREDMCDRDRVRDIGLAAQALLALVRFGAELVSVPHTVDLCGRQVGFELIEKLCDAYGASSSGKQTQNGRRVIHS